MSLKNFPTNCKLWNTTHIEEPPEDGSAFAVMTPTKSVPMIQVKSSAIRAVGWKWPRTINDAMKPVLYVMFTDGKLFEYKGVSLEKLLILMKGITNPAFSMGAYFNQEVRDQYEATSMD